MSADNGVYVLMTKAADGGVEYRVARAGAIENIFECPDIFPSEVADADAPEGLNTDMTRAYFGSREAYRDKALALLAAHDLEDGSTEYGVRIFDYSSLSFPLSDSSSLA